MNREDIRRIVIETIASTFDIETGDIADTTIADEVDGWDSLSHTVLMIRIGKRLGGSVPESVAAQAANVGEMIAMLGDHFAEN
ncbi:acyl carrier protein [Oleomonas cavernae]|uniref:Acyl carrier protein n=1 Tax=Oleomonas cavernae TaxID=2320859 RepID=A0A418WHE8_9PROT|nr:acyl carrier protein [Oleomonas cavernae]RJF89466.1 acyl carrier protein [Oleomonas cavernae]